MRTCQRVERGGHSTEEGHANKEYLGLVQPGGLRAIAQCKFARQVHRQPWTNSVLHLPDLCDSSSSSSAAAAASATTPVPINLRAGHGCWPLLQLLGTFVTPVADPRPLSGAKALHNATKALRELQRPKLINCVYTRGYHIEPYSGLRCCFVFLCSGVPAANE